MDGDSENNKLQREISLGGGITPQGVTGNAKLRWDSAQKGLFSGFVARFNARQNAKNEGKIELIKANNAKSIAEFKAQLVSEIASLESIEAVMRADALLEHIKKIEKEVILLESAAQDLADNPPSAEEMANGAEQLDEGFLNRLEKRAEEATEEEIRAKWAKVLAAETRKPGTFSAKIMRIIDEIEPETAQLFQKICQHRIGDAIPVCLAGKLSFSDQKALEVADLMMFSTEGAFRSVQEKTLDGGENIWLSGFDNHEFIFSVPIEAKLELASSDKEDPITWSGRGEPDGVLAYPLTKAGEILASIQENKEKINFINYLTILSEFMPGAIVREFKKYGNSVHCVRIWKNGKLEPVAEA